MSNQDRLLNDEELKQECLTIIALQEYGTTPSNLSGEQIAKIGFASVDLYQFINTQKRLYAESVIGEDENNPAPREPWGASYRNQLRAEQRERIE